VYPADVTTRSITSILSISLNNGEPLNESRSTWFSLGLSNFRYFVAAGTEHGSGKLILGSPHRFYRVFRIWRNLFGSGSSAFPLFTCLIPLFITSPGSAKELIAGGLIEAIPTGVTRSIAY